MVARVGPVSAKFKGKLTLSDIKPPHSYSIAFEGQGGAAGFAKGGAQVSLSRERSTRLAYDVKANVGGKLAQIGSRLVDAAAKKVADDFFNNFNKRVAAAEDATVRHASGAGTPAIRTGADARPNTTLIFFAAGALVVFVVALVALLTELLFRDDPYLHACEATVVAVHEDAVELDRTVFYPMGGGQPATPARSATGA